MIAVPHSSRLAAFARVALRSGCPLLMLAVTHCKSGDRAPVGPEPPAVDLVQLTYADRQPISPASPAGVYWDGERLWVWSDRHRRQQSYERQRGRWVPGPTRRGPAGTQRCLVGRAALQGKTFCVGRYENAGVMLFEDGVPGGRPFGHLPSRAGFVDLVLLDSLGLVGVVDAVDHELLWLDVAGAVVGSQLLSPSSYRIGWAGAARVFVLSASAPQLVVFRVSADGGTHRVAQWQRTAPLRDACYDRARDVLWVAGPTDHAVRRHRGPIEYLGSTVLMLDGAALGRGEVAVGGRWELQAHGLSDPTRLAAFAGGAVVALTGSDRVAWLRPNTQGGTRALAQMRAGLAPFGLAGSDGLLAVAARLEDRIYLYAPLGQRLALSDTLQLDPTPRDALRDVGERLFYGTQLWSQASERPYGCNSCHWETGTDRRRHPGLLETRMEQTRPLGGVGALAPIFTPGQASTLAVAVNGLLRVLDDRHWEDPAFQEETLEVVLKGGARRRLSPEDKRRALSAFLARVPVPPGPYLRAQAPDVRALTLRGASIFLRDCVDCHAVRGGLPGSSKTHAAGLLQALRERPLVLGGTGFAHAGAGPSFTEVGNRISPLMGLSRGGPYFAAGSAPSLRDVVTRYSRVRPGVHSGAGVRAYDAQQAAALEAFLHAL
ncbi:MAG: hypothetical protein OXU20_12550 [Myxococcales bacterium]|nr:hypothetical protein [Myxococcales bacterium]